LRAFEATQVTVVVIDCGVALDFLLQNLSRLLLTSRYIDNASPVF